MLIITNRYSKDPIFSHRQFAVGDTLIFHISVTVYGSFHFFTDFEYCLVKIFRLVCKNIMSSSTDRHDIHS